MATTEKHIVEKRTKLNLGRHVRIRQEMWFHDRTQNDFGGVEPRFSFADAHVFVEKVVQVAAFVKGHRQEELRLRLERCETGGKERR